jgi:ATP-dependent DNA helicase RecG
MGLVDELGSGVRNIHKYGKIYFGYDPEIIEEDIFKIIFKTNMIFGATGATTEVTTEVTTEDKLKDARVQLLLQYCKEPRTSQEIMDYLKLKDKEHFRKGILKPLIESKMLLLTIPDKPRSPKQKYYSK